MLSDEKVFSTDVLCEVALKTGLPSQATTRRLHLSVSEREG
ncbi:hypothetical protein [Nostoc sp.]